MLPGSDIALHYRGRFAPTPSGPLHLGSLLTALTSWLQARCQQGQWLLRIDDLDRPRCVPGSDQHILRQLEAHGLSWDESPRYQSQHLAEYRDTLLALQARGQVYGCACTRAELSRSSRPGPDGLVYAGTCRQTSGLHGNLALRLRLQPGRRCLDDPWLGQQCRDGETEIGDFVLQRADGVIGYQLACVVDEAAQGITEVVRGSDLLGSSLRQICLQQQLGLPSPLYRHLPVLVNEAGAKLSKQNHAPALDLQRAARNLWNCLSYLGLEPPTALRLASVAEILGWARSHWQASHLASSPRSIAVNPLEE